jgi:hypothetical protein
MGIRKTVYYLVEPSQKPLFFYTCSKVLARTAMRSEQSKSERGGLARNKFCSQKDTVGETEDSTKWHTKKEAEFNICQVSKGQNILASFIFLSICTVTLTEIKQTVKSCP